MKESRYITSNIQGWFSAFLSNAHTFGLTLQQSFGISVGRHSRRPNRRPHTYTYTHTTGFFLPFFLLFLIKNLLERQVALVWHFYQKQKCWDKNKWVFFQNFSNHPFKSQTLISLCTNMHLIHASTHVRLPITYTPKHLHPSEALKLTDSGRGISSWYAGGARKPDGGRGFTKMAPKHSFSCVLHIIHYGSGCKCVCHIPKQSQQGSNV